MSIVAHLAGIILKAYAKPDEFRNMINFSLDSRKFDDTMNSLFSIAAKISLSVPRNTQNLGVTKELTLKKEFNPPVSVKRIYAGPFSYSQKYATHDLFAKTIAQKRSEFEKTIEQLIQREYPSSSSFESSADKIRLLDLTIGQMRNAFNQEIIQYTKKAINPKYFDPEKEFQSTLMIDSDIKNDIEALKSIILDRIYQPPDDAKAIRKQQLQHLGKTRGDITFSELNRLYVLADINEYKRITGLKYEDIVKLHQDMSDYIQLGLYEQANHRKSEALKQYIKLLNEPVTPKDELESAIAKLSEVALGQNLADVATQPDIQYFQYADNKILYPQQMYYLQELLKKR